MVRQHFNPSSGNALFLILIAVALFGALAYAITQSGRDRGTISRETNQIAAAEIVQFSGSVYTAYSRLCVGKEPTTCARFNNSLSRQAGGALVFGAIGTPADPSDYIFHPQGGGITPQVFEDVTLPCPSCSTTNTRPGHFTVFWANMPGVGTTTAATGSELAVIVTGLNNDVCLNINNKVGIGNVRPSISIANTGYTYGGAQPSLTMLANPDNTLITGKSMYCFVERTAPFRNIYILALKIY